MEIDNKAQILPYFFYEEITTIFMIELLDSLPVLSSVQSNELSHTMSVQIEVG